ncbi:MAG: DUF6294 family protein [Bryobacteraceae bacterium]
MSTKITEKQPPLLFGLVTNTASEKVFASSGNKKCGDCWMQGGARLTFRNDGSGQFTFRTRTDKTHSRDTWIQQFDVVDSGGNEVFYSGFFESYPMHSPDTVPADYYYEMAKSFKFPKDKFDKIAAVKSIMEC